MLHDMLRPKLCKTLIDLYGNAVPESTDPLDFAWNLKRYSIKRYMILTCLYFHCKQIHRGRPL